MEANVIDTPTIRVSCAGLCRIAIGSCFLLEINKNRGDILTPIGGVFHYNDEAHSFLVGLSAQFETGRDLRLTFPNTSLELFDLWFNRRVQREIDPRRELQEELNDEHALAIPESALGEILFHFLGCCRSEDHTTRHGADGRLTRYYAEIFSVSLPPIAEYLIFQATKSSALRLHLVTQEEVGARRSAAGLPISTSAAMLFTNFTRIQ